MADVEEAAAAAQPASQPSSPAAEKTEASKSTDAGLKEVNDGNYDAAATGATKDDARSATEKKSDAETADDAAATTDEPEEAAGDGANDESKEADAETKDTDMMDVDDSPAGEDATEATAQEPTTLAAKSRSRRKSSAPKESRPKPFSKKASRARLAQTDAKPGEHYFVKLKGFPKWPAIICDEEMLPEALLKSRPVSAKRPNGSYREDYADGGKNVANRTFPVVYLYTYEFGWVPAPNLEELDPETVGNIKMDKKRKDLVAAHELAAENNDLEYYKGVLHELEQDRIQKQEAAEARAARSAKKNKKAAKAAVDADEDVMMADADDDGELAVPDDPPAKESKKSNKKRKAEDSAETPTRSTAAKKPKIKVNPSPALKITVKDKAAAKTKSSKPGKEGKTSKASDSPPPAQDLAEDVNWSDVYQQRDDRRHQHKEILFCRHKLQRGLLTRDQEPKEEEIESMSEYIGNLESWTPIVSVMRSTKINKVLRAILKLEKIPKEGEFKIKARCAALLDKWAKVMEEEKNHGMVVGGVNSELKDAPAEQPTETLPDAAAAPTSLKAAPETKKQVSGSDENEEAKPAEEKKANGHVNGDSFGATKTKKLGHEENADQNGVKPVVKNGTGSAKQENGTKSKQATPAPVATEDATLADKDKDKKEADATKDAQSPKADKEEFV